MSIFHETGRRITSAISILATSVLIGSVALGVQPIHSNSVVEIRAINRVPDLTRPWVKSVQHSAGTGTLISNRHVITCAHVVRHATTVNLRFPGSAGQFSAEVMAIAQDLDLALLRLRDKLLPQGVRPVKISATPPRERDRVLVFGYPTGGRTIATTEGIVSRVEHMPVPGVTVPGIVVQVDAALNPGNSGGPAFANGRFVGIAMATSEQGQNIGYLQSGYEIQRFLRDVKQDGVYDGRLQFTVTAQPLLNPALRHRHNINVSETGVLITGGYQGQLKKGDVLTHIGKVSIDNEGMIRRWGRTFVFSSMIPSLVDNDRLEVRILRDGTPQKVVLQLDRKSSDLVQFAHQGRQQYFVYGPLVFSSINVDHLLATLPFMPALAADRHPIVTRMADQQQFPGEQLVCVTAVLDHPTVLGYDEMVIPAVESVNGKQIKNLRHLLDVLRSLEDEFVEIRFANTRATSLVLRRSEVPGITRDVIQRNDIHRTSSSDLASQWAACVDGQTDTAFAAK